MYNIMTKLINKRFYKTKEEAQQKCEDLYVETSGEGPVVLPWKQKEIAKE